MSKIMCIPCSVEFPSDSVYLSHKKSGHTHMIGAVALDALPVPTPPPGVLPEGVPFSAMPSAEFLEAVQRIEGPKEPEASSKPSQHPSELPKAAPIRLEYIYRGVCPDDRSQITTLELDVADKHFCIAICSACKKQLDTREVSRL